jgi:lipopolysaccharide heptosyltransferase I
VNRILIVRTSALGDIVHALPAVTALREAYPSARLDWVVDARHAELVELVPIVNRRIVIGGSTDEEGRARAGLSARLSDLRATVRELQAQRYDIAIDLQGLLRSAMIARWSGASRVVGFHRSRLREPIASLFYKETFNPSSAPGAHVVFKNLGLVEALGVAANRVEFPLERRDSAAVRQTLERVRVGGGRFAVINPGAGWPNKRWPPERLGALARSMLEVHGLPSVVLWGPGEDMMAGTVVSASGGAAYLAPPTSLSDLVTLASKATLFVAGDTGPLHVAVALGTPVVGIYGPTSPARTGPWQSSDITVSRHPQCRCANLRACRVRQWCLGDVSVEEVARAVTARLASAGTRA